MLQRLNQALEKIASRADLIFVLLMLLVVSILVIPLPTFLIDTFLALNIVFTIVILVVTILIRNPLQLSTLPAILLIATLARLSLSIATTRSILGHGDAGHIVRSFGTFVVSGSVGVGLVIFLVIALVQFIVITKGAERIAEVAARFTLDAMPGKQMAIDADLRSGEIDNGQANQRRKLLERESQFFGAMDGAMKFVKGDAIAGLVIVVVNLIGGLLIGMISLDMKFGDAVNLFSILTIGDGLVAQLPALVLAMAAGSVVTRVASDESSGLGGDILHQLLNNPRVLWVAGASAAALGLVPGFPTAIFVMIALACFMAAWRMSRVQPEEAEPAAPAESAGSVEAPAIAKAEFGELVVLRMSPEQRATWSDLELHSLIEDVRRNVRDRYGFAMSAIAVAGGSKLRGAEYWLEIDSVAVARARHLADGELKAWLENALCDVPDRLFGFEEAGKWLSNSEKSHPQLVGEVLSMIDKLKLVTLCRLLLLDGIPLKAPRLILEAILQNADLPLDDQAQAVRHALRDLTVRSLENEEGVVEGMVLGPETLQQIRDMNDSEFEPVRVSFDIAQKIRERADAVVKTDDTVPIVTDNEFRAPLMKRIRELGSRRPVLGWSDISPRSAFRQIALIEV